MTNRKFFVADNHIIDFDAIQEVHFLPKKKDVAGLVGGVHVLTADRNESELKIFFNGGRTIELKGEAATRTWEKIRLSCPGVTT